MFLLQSQPALSALASRGRGVAGTRHARSCEAHRDIHHLTALILYPAEYLLSEQQRNKTVPTSPRSALGVHHPGVIPGKAIAARGSLLLLQRCLPLMSEQKYVHGGKGNREECGARRTLPQRGEYCWVSANTHACPPACPGRVPAAGRRRLSGQAFARGWRRRRLFPSVPRRCPSELRPFL